jgi:hypothetical protein
VRLSPFQELRLALNGAIAHGNENAFSHALKASGIRLSKILFIETRWGRAVDMIEYLADEQYGSDDEEPEPSWRPLKTIWQVAKEFQSAALGRASSGRCTGPMTPSV